MPPIPGLGDAGYWTNREATTFAAPPSSAVILGGGPVGIELAQPLRRFGGAVQLVESADQLLSREDRRVGELILEALRADGIDVHLNAEVESVSASAGSRTVRLEGSATASELIVATGRRPRIKGLALESMGIEPGPRGIEVDERRRAAQGVWAAGDVTGVMPFTHVAKYQGRLVCADVAGAPVQADYTAIPRVVFSDPEVAAVGMTETAAADAGIDAVSSTIQLSKTISRPFAQGAGRHACHEQEDRAVVGRCVRQSERRGVRFCSVPTRLNPWRGGGAEPGRIGSKPTTLVRRGLR